MSSRGKRQAKKARPDIDLILTLPDAPTFHPTAAEFADPIEYIESIRAVAEPFGICKIVPPPEWPRPEALKLLADIRFTARTQNLAVLDAELRARAHFADQVQKFLSLNGVVYSDELTLVDGRPVDLCLLHRAVTAAGGATALDAAGATTVAASTTNTTTAAGTNATTTTTTTIAAAVATGEAQERCALAWFQLAKTVWCDAGGFDERSVATQAARARIGAGLARVYRSFVQPWVDFKASRPAADALKAAALCNSLARRFGMRAVTPSAAAAGAGVPAHVPAHVHAAAVDSDATTRSVSGDSDDREDDATENLTCEICKTDHEDLMMLLCDDCNYGYHGTCLNPPVLSVPETQWFCESCVAKGRFGEYAFAQNSKQYSLEQFRHAAQRFKSAHFGGGRGVVALEAVEREFWRIVTSSSGDDDDDDDDDDGGGGAARHRAFDVEYGADLHTTKHGSGFPLDRSALGRSDWNLTNIALSRNSLLRHCNSEIDGVIRPWLYVGMVFSAFCWHNEDHYLPSINYLHAGAEKRWFGIAGVNAPQFEAVMHDVAAELFEEQPDLLLQLVTILSPARLVRRGVPVVQLTQSAGDFVVTFPAAYHTGYNTGFNVAEAVNFAMPDWLPFGALCRSMYRRMRRAPVFSYVELMCNIARASPSLRTAIWLQASLAPEVDAELALRAAARADGALFERRAASSFRACGELACHACAESLYLSAVVCLRCSDASTRKGDDDKSVLATCLEHRAALCACGAAHQRVLYCGDDGELRALVASVASVADGPAAWLALVAPLFAPLDDGNRCDISPLWLSINELLARGRALLEQIGDPPAARENLHAPPPSVILERNRFAPSAVPALEVARDVVSSLRDRLRAAICALEPLVANVALIQRRLSSLAQGAGRMKLNEAMQVRRCASLLPFLFDPIHVKLVDDIVGQASATEPFVVAAREQLLAALSLSDGERRLAAIADARRCAVQVLGNADALRVELPVSQALRDLVQQYGAPEAALSGGDTDAAAAAWCASVRSDLAARQLTRDAVEALLASQYGATWHQGVQGVLADLRSCLVASDAWDAAAIDLFGPIQKLCDGSLTAALTKPHVARLKAADKTRICVCGGQRSGVVLHCETCDEDYHAFCVGFDIGNKTPARYLCPLCCSTCRPRLRDVVALCARGRALHSVPQLLVVVEQEAMRALEWLHRSRSAMANPLKTVHQVKQLLDEVDRIEVTMDATPALVAFVAEQETATALAAAQTWVQDAERGARFSAVDVNQRLSFLLAVSARYSFHGAVQVLRVFAQRSLAQRGADRGANDVGSCQRAAAVCALCDAKFEPVDDAFACFECKHALGGPMPVCEEQAKRRRVDEDDE
jgi:hypothetical protein